jgi:serine protease Do
VGGSEKVDVGDMVLALGSPFGLCQSLTHGIISAKGRRNLKLGANTPPVQDFLQTDAPINPGNSGGPLVNLHGEVIGINTAIASNTGVSEGFGFAIPSDIFMFAAKQLIEKGRVTRSFIGVRLDSKFGPARAAEMGLPRLLGALVTEVTPRSPAETAAILPGDVILEFNHVAIEDDGHLVKIVSISEAGATVPVLIFRNKKTLTIQVEVADREKYSQ